MINQHRVRHSSFAHETAWVYQGTALPSLPCDSTLSSPVRWAPEFKPLEIILWEIIHGRLSHTHYLVGGHSIGIIPYEVITQEVILLEVIP